MEEKFSKIHHEIVSEIGTILSHLGADSGIMANVMSWGDTQDSIETLKCLKDYREEFIDPIEGKDYRYSVLSNQFQRLFRQYNAEMLSDLKQLQTRPD